MAATADVSEMRKQARRDAKRDAKREWYARKKAEDPEWVQAYLERMRLRRRDVYQEKREEILLKAREKTLHKAMERVAERFEKLAGPQTFARGKGRPRVEEVRMRAAQAAEGAAIDGGAEVDGGARPRPCAPGASGRQKNKSTDIIDHSSEPPDAPLTTTHTASAPPTPSA